MMKRARRPRITADGGLLHEHVACCSKVEGQWALDCGAPRIALDSDAGAIGSCLL